MSNPTQSILEPDSVGPDRAIEPAQLQFIERTFGEYLAERASDSESIRAWRRHLLSADCLHMVRTISNIETPQQKLVTCLLFGESRLLQRLDHASYASLNNRIYLRAELRPLTAAEVAQYIKYRVLSAGRLTELFTEGALAAVHELSEGICRNVNKLAMLSLIEAGDMRAAVVDEAIVRLAARRM